MRRSLAWVFVVLALVLIASPRVFGDSPTSVTSAIVGRDPAGITRFTVRFSAAMAPLGQGTPPLAMTCPVPGAGRWIDPQTYVWEYARPLPAGLSCKATLNDDLKDAAGAAIGGTKRFPIDSGGPVVLAILPDGGTGGGEDDEDGGSVQIEEEQAFLVAANGPVDRASIAAGAYCAVDGIGERIPVDLLPPQTAEQVLTAIKSGWLTQSFLQSAGLPQPLPASAKLRAAALANVVALKCRRPLPPGRDMALVWGASIRSPSGHKVGEDHRYDFKVRKEFSARLTCSRANANAGCDPIEAIAVEFSAPVARADAMKLRLEVAPGRALAPKQDATDHSATVSQISFVAPFPPAITAHLLMPAGLRDESGRTLANARRFPLDVDIADAPPLVKFAAPFGILEAREGGVLPVTVRSVEPRLMGQVAAISGVKARIDNDDDATIADWLRRVAKSQADDMRDEKNGGKTVTINHTGDRPVLGGEDGGTRMNLGLPGGGHKMEVVGIPLEKPGFYVVELASPRLGRALLGRPATRYVAASALVTNMAVHFKWGRGASLAWVTALDSGKPVGDALVAVTDSCSGHKITSGRTDASGRLTLRGLPDPSNIDGCESSGADSPPLIVSARKDGDMSFVLTSWGEGIQPWNFDLPYGWQAPEPIFHTIFDRTLLRAGETVHMTHVYRRPVLTGFRSGGALKGVLQFKHRGSDMEFDVPVTIDRAGMGESSWTPPKGAPTGDYDLTLQVGDKTQMTGQSIRVDEYRLPTMRASVSGPREPAVRPKRLPLDLYVGYLSGGGAGHAPVRLRAAFAPLSSVPSGWEGWTFGGAAVREGTVPLDEDQNDLTAAAPPPAITLPVALDAHGALRTALDMPALADAAQMTVEMDYDDANGETLTASTAIPIYTSAVRLGLKPDGWMQRAGAMRLKVAALTADGKIIARQRVSVALYTREILSARRRLIGGFYAFDNSAKTTRIAAHCSTSTDSHGMADCDLDPGVSGEVIAVATTKDADGNEARAVTSVWLAGDDDWWFGGDNGDRMDIVPDAKTYRAGDVAHVQVRMPFRSATALVTVEREGVLSSFVTTISGKDPVVNVPLPGAYAPDVFISVMAVRGRIAGWRLWLADFARRWHLPFFSQDGAYPTALVDLAKPAYRIGIAKVAVGWEAHQLKVAVQTDHQHYPVRGHARVGVRVLGPDGKAPRQAEIAFAAVDEALLQLSPNDSWDILDKMMGERPLSVLTSTAQMQVVGKRHYGLKAVASGGGGGGDLSSLTRSDFRPVLLWRGRVKLDAQGRAMLDVPLADSLSAYRLVAIATAGGDLFGTGSASIRTVQDLTIYAGVPPLVRSGDFYGATFTLRNGTDRPMKVTANVTLAPAIARGASLTVTIPAGGAAPVTWRLTAPLGLDKLHWTVTARSADGHASDRMAIDEQVVPAVPEQVWAATLLHVGPSSSIPVGPPPGALPGRGGIDVALMASPAPPLTGVRAYMLAYPYGCFEQRLSKAVALDDRAAWAKQMDALPTYVAANGLLHYWPMPDEPGSIALTAYALSLTADASLPWPDTAKAGLIEALRGVVDGRITEEGNGPGDARLLRLAALAALARNGAATPAMVDQLAMPLGDMPTVTLADWLITLDHVAGVDPRRIQAAEAALRSRIVYEGTRLDLTDNRNAPWWMMVSDDEMALKALLAVSGRPGWQADAPRMMVGIALRQMQGHWDTTPANAWGTLAVRRFAAAYPGSATGLTTATLGGKTMTSNALQPPVLHLPLPRVPGALLLKHDGDAGPWATVSVRAAVPLTAPAFAGYRISREVSFLQRQRPDRISRGDVVRVRITVDAPVDRTWVVIDDPIPAGASILGAGGGQSALLAAQAGGGNGWPSYVEQGLDAWRGYFRWMPKGKTTVEYAVRLNGTGRLQLPPTRVEAMYSPEIHAALPNGTLTIVP
ncbi:MAG TPA: MG2 domain-containing protein [Sphingomonas sp.]|uniref:alpha-2-macroglobulin family protein n=1 Tax=Sphingomonas sp. TaxID=28214 RepID=UPI002D16E141|nr:MG2 domain-containing protein [Sphingomonas sp.]HMI18831.1 MG2 domain-containing protein [Sphingomonas sp.]